MMTAPSCRGEPGRKHTDQKVVADLRVERDAALNVVAQPDFPFDRDDGALTLLGQHTQRHHDLLDRLVGRLRSVEIPEERGTPEVHERTPDVRLEQHDRREGDVAEHISDQPVERLQRSKLRCVVQRDDQTAAEKNLNRMRATDQLQQLVEQQ